MSYRLEVWLALLLAVAIGVAVWAANRSARPVEPDSRASTFVSGPNGSKAVYDVLVRLGRPVERRRTALFNLNHDSARGRGRSLPGLLVLANPPIPLQDAELDEIMEFVELGGAVFAARSGGGVTSCAGWRIVPDQFVAESVALRPRPEWRDLRLPRVTRMLAPDPRDAGRGLDRLTKGDAPTDSCDRLVAQAQDTLLATVDGRPVALRLHYEGGGTITLLADVGWLRNRVWRAGDVARVVLPWLTPPRGRASGRQRVTWAEYHQGFREDRRTLEAATWTWLRETPIGWALLQLVAVALVWLGVSAVRFGPPRAVIERRRRSPLEHLEALAAGLESAGEARASDAAVHRIAAGLRRRLSRSGATTDRGPIEPWLDTLELVVRGARGRDAVRRLQLFVRGAGARLPAGERVLATAQAVEDVWEELRPRTTRDAS